MLSPDPAPIQHHERAARTNGGSSSHHLHECRPTGWPHRWQRGCGSSLARDQHCPHTMPSSPGGTSLSQETQQRGSSSSPTASSARDSLVRVPLSSFRPPPEELSTSPACPA